MARPRHFIEGLKREFDPRDPFIKREPRHLNNLWTGRTLGGRGKLIVGATAVGYGIHEISDARYKNIERDAEMLEPTPLPGTRGDGSTYTPHYTGLEVSGDLAFALHNLRHGGW